MNNFRGGNKWGNLGNRGNRNNRGNWNWSRGGGNGGGNDCGNNFGGFNNGPPPGNFANNFQSFSNNGNYFGNNQRFDDYNDNNEGNNGWMMNGPNFNPGDVLAWLDQQHPFVVRRVLFHCKWLCDQHESWYQDSNFGNNSENEGNSSSSNNETSSNNSKKTQNKKSNNKNKKLPKSRRPGFGWSGQGSQSQWTPEGWVIKDNSHKVTSKMRPLPPPEIIPPFSTQYPDASSDKDKLQMLKNNVNMMSIELNKICKRFKINDKLNKDSDLSTYPEEQREKLKMAINCLSGADKTLQDFQDFVKNEKYVEWNQEQKKIYEAKVKEMIGDTPEGTPYKKPKPDNENEEENPPENASATTD